MPVGGSTGRSFAMSVGVLLVFGGPAAADGHGVDRAVRGRFRGLRVWLGTDNLHPRIFDGSREALFCRSKVTLPTSQGSMTPIAKSSRRGEGRVSLCPRSRRDPEHQVLVYAYSGSVDRSRSDWYGRLVSQHSGRVSCVHDQRARDSTGRRKGILVS